MSGSRFEMARKPVITRSGDTSEIPAQRRSRRRRPRLWTLIARRELASSIVLVAAGLAVIPLILTTIAFGHAFRDSETNNADARLAVAERLGFERVSAAALRAATAARALAQDPTVQAAVERGDAQAAATYGYRRGDLSVSVDTGTPAPTPAPAETISTLVSIVASGATIGHVKGTVRLGPQLAAAGSGQHVELVLAEDGVVRAGNLRGLRSQGLSATPQSIQIRGAGYRVLRTTVVPGVDLVAAASNHSINAAVHRRQLVILGAGVLTIAALALTAMLLARRWRPAARRTQDRGGHRSPVALVGDVFAAAHDPRALLPVILETAVAAMDTPGGRVLWDGDEIAAIGSPPAAGNRLVFALDEPDESAAGGRQIELYAPRGGFTATAREIAEALVAQGRIALENARLHTVVRRQAVTDELTDLANRRRFMEVLEYEVARAARFGSPLALVLFDLDHFKQINDRYGHQIGDDVLRSTAEAIRNRVRETDLPARIGGEEFAIILAGTDIEGAFTMAEEFRIDLSQQVKVEGADWTVTASFGVAALHDNETAGALIGAADGALYRAKAEGRNRVCSETNNAPAY
jgi:diguanylate cyclase (GGDEF)-like protein